MARVYFDTAAMLAPLAAPRVKRCMMKIVEERLKSRALYVIVVTSIVAACSAGPEVAPSASVATSRRSEPLPASSPTTASRTGSAFKFESDRYGYEVRFPAGWYQRSEGPGSWTPDQIGYHGSGTDSFEEDFEGRGKIRNFPGVTYGFYVSAAQLSTPVGIENWAATLAGTMHAHSSCQGDPGRETMMVGAELAVVLVYDRSDCTHDHHVLVVGAIHESMGFDILWLAKRGVDDARRHQFDEIMATFKWTR